MYRQRLMHPMQANLALSIWFSHQKATTSRGFFVTCLATVAVYITVCPKQSKPRLYCRERYVRQPGAFMKDQQERKLRFIIFIFCTLTSCLGIVFSLGAESPLFIAAWTCYALIGFLWIKNNQVPKTLMLVGTVLGTLSVITGGVYMPLMFTGPAIGCMLHILKDTFSEVESFEEKIAGLKKYLDYQKNNLINKNRLSRLITATVCTGASFIGILASWPRPPSDYLNHLWLTAWVAYFLILFFWIKDNRAPKWLMVIGTLLGTLSVLSTFGWAMPFVFPAIGLMVYVLLLSFKDFQHAHQ